MAKAMSEEQFKAAETEATAQVEESVEDISEEDLEGVAGGFSGRTIVGVSPAFFVGGASAPGIVSNLT